MRYKLVLLRHGESVWNFENRFTGWTDVELSEKGVREAHQAGIRLANEKFTFDIAFTSVLKRAIRTLWIVLDEMEAMWIPVERHWQLNERHYGALQGLNKAQTAEKYGDDQVHLWRRGFDVSPPALDKDDPRHPCLDRRYAGLAPEQIPATESLKDTLGRVMPLWHNAIAPSLKEGKQILLVAHGNSLRAMVKHLDHLSDAETTALNIPTGIPLVYEFNESLQVLSHYYLGDADSVKAAAEAVTQQARKK